MGEISFVTGGARSGKSRFAERLARETGRPLVYLVTMVASDEELAARIAAHRRDRPEDARTIEEPRDPAGALAAEDGASCVLLDCLSLWVSNRLLELGETPDLEAVADLGRELDGEAERLIALARAREGETIVVTNEVGGGLVPEYPLGRHYRDLLGRVNQRAAAAADRAWLMVAGRPLPLPPAS
ncbi:MAG: bifunctional adenosylcobinamide kinase/adenosylcobinamide-phosphate guanylyltransferase [Chloroflexi bacterium]|nr:bifunctional adenosylcobinamide kinase/adenosylcobinamide-phosphate guanylyltransferase [Chloroflexota bacterium]